MGTDKNRIKNPKKKTKRAHAGRAHAGGSVKRAIAHFSREHSTIMRLMPVILIFLISFGSAFFFTQGFNFFWEDSVYFDEVGKVTKSASYYDLAAGFANIFSSTDSLFMMDYLHRPMDFYAWKLLPSFFGSDAANYRIFKALVFAFLATLIFVMLRAEVSLWLAISGVFMYISYDRLWVSLAYSASTGIYMHICTLLSLLIFYIYYYPAISRKGERWYSAKNIFLLVLILSFAHISISFKNEGRIIFPVIMLFILIRHIRDYAAIKRFAPLLLSTLIISVPVLGILKKYLFDRGFEFMLDQTTTGGISIPGLVLSFFRNISVPIESIGMLTLISLAACCAIILLYFLNKCCFKSAFLKDRIFGNRSALSALMLFSFIWLLAETAIVFKARSFDYPPMSFIEDLFFMFGPLVIFFISIVDCTIKSLKEDLRKIARTAAFLVLLLIILLQLYHLNAYRGAWGDYFMGWGDAVKYIDSRHSNAVIMMTKVNNFPAFSSRNTIVMISDLGNQSLIEEAAKNYTAAFIINDVNIAGKKPLAEYEEMILIEKLNVKDDSLYAKIKLLMGRKSMAEFWIYRYIPHGGLS